MSIARTPLSSRFQLSLHDFTSQLNCCQEKCLKAESLKFFLSFDLQSHERIHPYCFGECIRSIIRRCYESARLMHLSVDSYYNYIASRKKLLSEATFGVFVAMLGGICWRACPDNFATGVTRTLQISCGSADSPFTKNFAVHTKPGSDVVRMAKRTQFSKLTSRIVRTLKAR